ncbi:hypothetical protein DSOL_0794 [Desulfosporosinus metallidurans]|uniref:Uncharacterized protein n=1 Tax=Desulfosporosinus metallidurans TaxID=1888891 RepID=A0A1Q8R1S6_9FIRM|nr:hypothetical protein DSOL_0794 [Desulfosporosinus metallidurans]
MRVGEAGYLRNLILSDIFFDPCDFYPLSYSFIIGVYPEFRINMGVADATLNQGMGLTQKEYLI